jgi:tetratricopeptide (TPR) repeat protein
VNEVLSPRRIAVFSLVCAGLLAVCPVQGQTASLVDVMAKANAAQSRGRYADAAKLYAHATVISPAIPELWSNRGVMEYLAGNVDASTISLKHALRLNPKMYVPMLFLGKAYLQSGKPALAVPYLERAHKLQPNDPEVLLTLGKADAKLERQREAAAAYASAAQLTPDNPVAWLGLGTASLQGIALYGRELADSQPKSVWSQTLYADELLAQGRPLEAVDKYHAALASVTPGEAATVSRNVDWLQTHPDLFPLPANSQDALQRLDAELQKSYGSGASSHQCAADAPPLEAAACAFWAGEYETSMTESGKALAQSPKSAEALYWSIKASERIAVAALARFEELAPHSAASFVMVGDLFRDQRQMDNALGEYKKALAIDANDPGALLGTVVADLAGSKLDEAAAMDQSALASRPDDPQLNLLMAEVLAAGDHYSEMRPYLTKCLAGPPELQPRVHLLLGRADAQEGKNDEAIREYLVALPSDQDGSIHFQLSRLYRKTGNVAGAQKAEADAKALLAKRRASAVIEVRESTAANP